MDKRTEPKPTVTHQGVLDLQVCVPESWADEQVVRFANASVMCGTSGGWQIRTDEESLRGDPVRRPCAERAG